jgi:hypothetical protein
MNKTSRIKQLQTIGLILFMIIPIIGQVNGFNNIITLPKNSIDLILKSDGQIRSYIIISNQSINSTMLTSFNNQGGVVLEGPWEGIDGFAGVINSTNLTNYLNDFPMLQAIPDSIITTQMNMVHQQLKTYPAVIDLGGYNYNGSNNASIAFVDSGIDPTHIAFNASYGELSFTDKIIGWKDFVNNALTPEDLNGHGTAIASIAVGEGSQVMERNSTTSFGSSITAGGNYSHYDLFYPNHITPKWYRFKIASLNIQKSQYNLSIQANFEEYSNNQLKAYQLELYNNGNLVNISQISTQTMNISYNTSSITSDLFDIVFAYEIDLGKNPLFNLHLNATFVPLNSLENFANFTGIAPETKVTALRILNNTGMGNLSTLITALDWIKENNSLYQIASVVLSIGAFNVDTAAIGLVNNMIEKIIDNGTMVIIAAGNRGVGSDNLNNLAFSNKAIVVGAMNNRDQVTYYSSQGMNSGQYNNRPDVIAPGGSWLFNQSQIIAADTNQIENSVTGNEKIYNDSTIITGTSVAAAIVGGLYNLILQQRGNWENLNITNTTALWIKSLILMTASETNLLRENNPLTSYNESLSSPILDRVAPDAHEGYGRINPKAIFDMLNNYFVINSTILSNLTASNSNSSGEHVYARAITLEQNEIYKFDLRMGLFTTLDADLHLYANQSDSFGNPILLKSSTQSGNNNELFYYTNPNATQDFFIVIKAISGTGYFTLNITKMNNTIPPQLSNASVIASSNYNDTLDIYSFRINYTQAENFAPVNIVVKINSTQENLTMYLSEFQGPFGNYTTTTWYQANRRFYTPGNYSYYFIVHTGNFYVRYPESENITFTVSEIQNISQNFYSTSFTTTNDVQGWQFSTSPINFSIQGYNEIMRSGWAQIQMTDLQEYRASNLPYIWGAMYCGITVDSGLFNMPIVNPNTNQIQYTYLLMNGTHDLISPMINLSSKVYEDPSIRIGLRTSINLLDRFQIQVNANRTGWITLQEYTNSYVDWFYLNLDLSDYMDTYLQIRFRSIYDEILDPEARGIMIDYFSVQEQDKNNTNQPILKAIQATLISTEPYYVQKSKNAFDYVTFQVSYVDIDGTLPEFVLVEINGKNYSMANVYGKWNSTATLLAPNGIIYKANISLFGQNNTSFKFHAKDGNYSITLDPKQIIQLEMPEAITIPISSEKNNLKYITSGTPSPIIHSIWIGNLEGWHQPEQLGVVLNAGEWYCGVGNYYGYKNNWDTRLILSPIQLNGTNEVFLTFDYQYSPDMFAGNDYFQLEISLDNGFTWKNITSYPVTNNEYIRINQDVTAYMNKTVLFGFRFITDNTGSERTLNSGVYLANIRIDINRTRDYIKPQINYLNFTSGQKISGIVSLQIEITDNMGLNPDRLKFYVDGKLIPVTIIDGYIYYTIDSSKYENGYIIEIVTMAYDLQENRLTKKLLLEVDNPPPTWVLGLFYGGISLGILFIVGFGIQKWKIKQLMAKGDYRPKPSWRDRLEENQFKKQRIAAETRAILNRYDKKWEKDQPMTLYCTKCKKWFNSPGFEIYCPVCDNDSLYLAKYCPICDKWRYFEAEGLNKCKKCNIVLLKDFDKARIEILSRSNAQELTYDETQEEANK